DQVWLGVAVELDDALDGVIGPEKCEGRDEHPGAHASHNVELRACHGPRGHPPPALQESRTERAPVAATRDNEDVEDRRRRHTARLLRIVLRLHARDDPAHKRTAVLRELRVSRLLELEEFREGAGGPFERAASREDCAEAEKDEDWPGTPCLTHYSPGAIA